MNKVNIAVSLKKQSIHKEGNTNIVNIKLEHYSLYDKGIQYYGTLKEQDFGKKKYWHSDLKAYCCCLVISDSCDPMTIAHQAPLWKFPGKNTGVDCHALLQGIFPTQRSNRGLLHWQGNSLPLSHQGSLKADQKQSNEVFQVEI